MLSSMQISKNLEKLMLTQVSYLNSIILKSLRTTIIIIIIKKKHFKEKQEDLLIMQLVIHLNRQDVMNAINVTLINNQNARDTFSKNFVQIKAKLNMKINKIKKLYELKEKNLSKIIL